MNRINPAFWKCPFGCVSIKPRCCPVAKEYESLPHATNKEVFIAWLEAGDERRKELELASRPTKKNHVKQYITYWMYELTGTPRDTIWSYSDYTAHMDYPDVGGLWIPIEEN